MTDLEQFSAFFKSKGVKFDETKGSGQQALFGESSQQASKHLIHVEQAEFQFDEHGRFLGVPGEHNYQWRLPAPEGE